MSTPWIVVTKTFGIVDAQIIAGRLDAEGIPVRVRPEEIGHHIGITIGKLGQVAIEVPAAFLEEAVAVLSFDFSDDDFDEYFDDDEDEEYDGSFPDIP